MIGNGDPRFYRALYDMAALHDRKQSDYGRDHDPFANVRASEDFGIPGWIGALVRGNDKMKRLQKAARGDNLANESIEDSLLDGAIYFVIALVLFRERQASTVVDVEYEERAAQMDAWTGAADA